jgi:purine-binding chemotaxis protein CheW
MRANGRQKKSRDASSSTVEQAPTPAEKGQAAVALAEAVLRERAREYARTADSDTIARGNELLIFRAGAEEYAAELHRLRGVLRVSGLTPVPCTPALVAGVLNVRGELVSVLDLAVLLGLESSASSSADAEVVLVEASEALVGLLVDSVVGVNRIDLGDLDGSFSGRDYVRGVADSRIVVLDIDRLLMGGRLDALNRES